MIRYSVNYSKTFSVSWNFLKHFIFWYFKHFLFFLIFLLDYHPFNPNGDGESIHRWGGRGLPRLGLLPRFSLRRVAKLSLNDRHWRRRTTICHQAPATLEFSYMPWGTPRNVLSCIVLVTFADAEWIHSDIVETAGGLLPCHHRYCRVWIKLPVTYCPSNYTAVESGSELNRVECAWTRACCSVSSVDHWLVVKKLWLPCGHAFGVVSRSTQRVQEGGSPMCHCLPFRRCHCHGLCWCSTVSFPQLYWIENSTSLQRQAIL